VAPPTIPDFSKEFHEKLKARVMATTTIDKRIQLARQFMRDAGILESARDAKSPGENGGSVVEIRQPPFISVD
jgi:hypothetical protein